jgi:DNA-binding MarR family transcriptional regulator
VTNSTDLFVADTGRHVAPAEPRVWAGYLVNQLAWRFRSRTADLLLPLGLTPPLLRLVGIIAVDQPLTQRQLGARAGMDRTTIMRHVDRLAQAGLLARQPVAGDRRAHALMLTADGMARLAEATEAAAAVEESLLASLSEDERAMFVRLLLRLHSGHAANCPEDDQPEGDR